MKPIHLTMAGPPPRATRSLACRGFTLIELLVVFVLLAVLLTLAAPSFITFQRNAELTSSANSFVAALSAARAEAMKRQLRVFVIPGNGSSASNNWATGWTVFVDMNSNATAGSVLPESGTDTIVSQQGALPSTVSITASSFGDGTTAYVMFNGSGFVTLIDKTFLNESIEMSNGSESRRVIVNPNGRFRVCKPPPADTTCTESAL